MREKKFKYLTRLYTRKCENLVINKNVIRPHVLLRILFHTQLHIESLWGEMEDIKQTKNNFQKRVVFLIELEIELELELNL